jgi:two-component system response regulator YesN
MIKAVIVEDKYVTRQGLVRDIDWQGLGFELAGQAPNGRKGLELIRTARPDVVITDIMMPDLDGLAMMEQVRESYPDIFFIIISGHDDFEYAQRALKAGAYDYLLKPIELRDVNAVLEKVKQEFLKRAESQARLSELKWQSEESRELVRRQLYKDLIMGRLDQDEIKARSRICEEETADSWYALGMITIENYNIRSQNLDYLQLMDLDSDLAELVNRITAPLANHILVIERQVGERILCFKDSHPTELKAHITMVVKAFQQISETDYLLALSGTHQNAANLTAAFSEVLETARQRLLLKGDRVIRFESLGDEIQDSALAYIDFDDSLLLTAIKTCDRQKTEAELDCLLRIMQEQKVASLLHMMMITTGLYFKIIRLAADFEADLGDGLTDSAVSFSQLISQTSAEGMVSELKQLSKQVMEHLSAQNSGRHQQIILRARDYIDRNYHKEDLAMEVVAQHSHVSVSYLGAIFRQETQETFIEYLTGLRMKKARELLLKTDLKTYEIAQKIGYSNPTYFSTIFKKYYGKTPSTMRQDDML